MNPELPATQSTVPGPLEAGKEPRKTADGAKIWNVNWEGTGVKDKQNRGVFLETIVQAAKGDPDAVSTQIS